MATPRLNTPVAPYRTPAAASTTFQLMARNPPKTNVKPTTTESVGHRRRPKGEAYAYVGRRACLPPSRGTPVARLCGDTPGVISCGCL